MNHIYLSKETDPYFNVAFEYELFKSHQTGIWLFLWKNKPSVFIGRNQNLYRECHLEYCESHHILPVRRYSGGGAVYQDEGNLNFTLYFYENEYDLDQVKQYLKHVLDKLGIENRFSGRNDLLSHDKKISGQAYYQEDDHIFYHGTLLFDVDVEQLYHALNPSKLKLASKGIASVKSRVANLKDFYPSLSMQQLEKTCIDVFQAEYGICLLDEVLKEAYPQIDKSSKQLQQKEWLYKESPQFEITLEESFPFGLVQVMMNVEDGKIIEAKIYTDSLDNIDIASCQKNLVGMWLEPHKVIDVIKKYVL